METRTKYFRNYACEVRADQNEEHGHFIYGKPIVFGSETDIGGFYREIIDPGALDDADLRDVRFLVNHDLRMIPLARSRNNNENSTMRLEVAGDGLNIRADLDTERNETSRSLYSAVERGDISGMSFMFTVKADAWEDLDTEYPVRHITGIDKVFEVSAVTAPAYEETSIEARADADALESARALLESKRAEEAEKRAARVAELEKRLNALRGE